LHGLTGQVVRLAEGFEVHDVAPPLYQRHGPGYLLLADRLLYACIQAFKACTGKSSVSRRQLACRCRAWQDRDQSAEYAQK
jgi:hypothetical protein